MWITRKPRRTFYSPLLPAQLINEELLGAPLLIRAYRLSVCWANHSRPPPDSWAMKNVVCWMKGGGYVAAENREEVKKKKKKPPICFESGHSSTATLMHTGLIPAQTQLSRLLGSGDQQMFLTSGSGIFLHLSH